jgi:2-dehydropantoate 2-reductase
MGAIGGYVGGMLTKAGVDVTFVEPWQAHIDAVRAQDGLLVKDAKAGEFLVDVKVLAISDLATNTELFDYCIIAMKSYDTEWAAKLMEQHVKPDSGAFISIQNGINDYRPLHRLRHHDRKRLPHTRRGDPMGSSVALL